MSGKIIKEIHEKGAGTLFFVQLGGVEHKFFIPMQVLGDDPFVEQPILRLWRNTPKKTFPEIFESHKAFLERLCTQMIAAGKESESPWGIEISRKDVKKYGFQPRL